MESKCFCFLFHSNTFHNTQWIRVQNDMIRSTMSVLHNQCRQIKGVWINSVCSRDYSHSEIDLFGLKPFCESVKYKKKPLLSKKILLQKEMSTKEDAIYSPKNKKWNNLSTVLSRIWYGAILNESSTLRTIVSDLSFIQDKDCMNVYIVQGQGKTVPTGVTL